jgi:hypothetical protein
MAERRGTFILLLAVITLAGCRGATPQPVVRAGDQKATPAAAPAPPAPSSAPVADAPPKSEPVRDDAPVVVDPGGEDGTQVSLVEAARAEKERRAHAGQPVAVITDKTLPKYAAKGQITVADPKKKGAAGAAPSPGAVAAGPVRDEAYWRGRALEIRQRWRRAADDVKELEQRSTELRQKFYLEGDTFTRDNQIKPEWDRVLDKLRQTRLDAETAQKELAEFLEEGQAAGIMPGWLREGEEEEPAQPKKQEATPPAESIEPPVLEPPPPLGGRGGGR